MDSNKIIHKAVAHHHVNNKVTSGSPKVNVVRYADDFVCLDRVGSGWVATVLSCVGDFVLGG